MSQALGDYRRIAPLLRCPQCTGALDFTAEVFACQKCRRVYPFVNGVPLLASKADYFFNELPKPTMDALLEDVRQLGWEDGFARLLETLPSELAEDVRQYVTDEGRVSPLVLLTLPADATALDFGCGWGTLSLGLSEYCSRVVAADLTMQRIQITNQRALEAGRTNLFTVCAGDSLQLPFASSSFDVVLLSGVLEWVASGVPGNPKAVQLAFLKEVSRILKPDGQLYLAIENRFWYQLLTGSVDPHSRKRFTTLFPHALARIYSRIRYSSDYRTPIYSYRGYRRLLHRAGFRRLRFFLPFPSYSRIDRILNAETPRAAMNAFAPMSGRGRLSHGVAKVSGAYPWFAHSYGIVAQLSATALPSFVEQMLDLTAASLGLPAGTYRFTHLLVTRDHKLVIFTEGGEKGRACPVFQLAVSDSEALWLTHAASVVGSIHADRRIPGHLKAGIPEVLWRGELGGRTFVAHTLVSGIRADRLPARLRPLAVRLALRFVTDLHAATAVREENPDLCLSVLRESLDIVARACPDALAADLYERCLAVLQSGSAQGLPLVRLHGDFGLYNVFVSRAATELNGVIDWDSSEERGMPLYDALTVLLTGASEDSRPFTEHFISAIEQVKDTSAVRSAMDEYCAALKLQPAQTAALLLASFFRGMRPLLTLEQVYPRRVAVGRKGMPAGLSNATTNVLDLLRACYPPPA